MLKFLLSRLTSGRKKKLQSYRATELQASIFFRRKLSYKATTKVTKLRNFVTFEKKGLFGKSYRVTGLQTPIFFSAEKKFRIFFSTKKSYRVTELQGYRHQIFFGRKKNHDGRKKKLQSYRVTELQASIFFQRKPSYKATTKVTKLHNFVTFKKKGLFGKSYRVTELQGYRHQFFFHRKKNFGIFFQKKKVTELQSYRATGLNFFPAETKLQSYNKSYKAT